MWRSLAVSGLVLHARRVAELLCAPVLRFDLRACGSEIRALCCIVMSLQVRFAVGLSSAVCSTCAAPCAGSNVFSLSPRVSLANGWLCECFVLVCAGWSRLYRPAVLHGDFRKLTVAVLGRSRMVR